jgi:hypothetical protein
MFRVEVGFRDHSEDVFEDIILRADQICDAAAVVLRDGYQRTLTSIRAKPHSPVGAIPYKYDGPNLNGYDPALFDRMDGRKNNLVEDGFARDQTDFLANYLRSNRGMIGFSRSGHVAHRTQNYLLSWDGKDKSFPGTDGNRPWIKPIYRQYKSQMIAEVRRRLRSRAISSVSDDVPF